MFTETEVFAKIGFLVMALDKTQEENRRLLEILQAQAEEDAKQEKDDDSPEKNPEGE